MTDHPYLLRARTRLDRAILASVLATLAMNLVVMAQQMPSLPRLLTPTEERA